MYVRCDMDFSSSSLSVTGEVSLPKSILFQSWTVIFRRSFSKSLSSVCVSLPIVDILCFFSFSSVFLPTRNSFDISKGYSFSSSSSWKRGIILFGFTRSDAVLAIILELLIPNVYTKPQCFEYIFLYSFCIFYAIFFKFFLGMAFNNTCNFYISFINTSFLDTV